MPIRDFWCPKCGKELPGIMQKLDEEPPICCGKKMQQYWEGAPSHQIVGLPKDRFKH